MWQRTRTIDGEQHYRGPANDDLWVGLYNKDASDGIDWRDVNWSWSGEVRTLDGTVVGTFVVADNGTDETHLRKVAKFVRNEGFEFTAGVEYVGGIVGVSASGTFRNTWVELKLFPKEVFSESVA